MPSMTGAAFKKDHNRGCDGANIVGATDRIPAFEPPAMWENEHITRHWRQTRRAVFGSAIDVA
jgi:hypothetical protein